MGIVNIVKKVKKIHRESIVFIRVGSFYNCYGRDAYITSYLFGYKINILKEKYGVSIRVLVNIAIRNVLIEDGISLSRDMYISQNVKQN